MKCFRQALLVLLAASWVDVIRAQPRVVGFTLIQAGSNTPLTSLVNGTVVTIPPGATPNYNVDAATTAGFNITSVQFFYNNAPTLFRNEINAPWAMCGNIGTVFLKCNVLVVGTHTVSAQPMGGPRYTVTFVIAAPGAPVPVAPVPIAPVPIASTPTTAPVPAPKTPVTLAPQSAPVKAPTTKAPTNKVTPTIAPVTKAPVVAAPSLVPMAAPVTRAPKAPKAAAPKSAPVTKVPTKVPVAAATKAPVASPTSVPVTQAPTNAPVNAPKSVPVAQAPVAAPMSLLTPTPVSLAPVALSPVSKAPLPFFPTLAPVVAPLGNSTAPTQSNVSKAPTVATAPSSFAPILLNCGGGAYTDSAGQMWRADAFFSGGGTYTTQDEISGTNDDGIYQSERFGQVTYNIAVPPGRYTVTLYLAEIFHWSPSSRIFDVQVEGTMLADIDLVAIAGSRAAVQRSVTVFVTDGSLTIRLLRNVPAVDEPKLSGIFVTLALPGPPTPAPTIGPSAAPTPIAIVPAFEPILINCGGGRYIDAQRRLWRADRYWTGGLGTVTSTAPIAETDEDSLFQTYRYGEAIYEIPISRKGLYEVVLYFAESYFGTEFQRIFDVMVEKTKVTGIDMVDLGGGMNNLAITRTAPAVVIDGFLTIELIDQVNHAVICAIEVNRIGEAPPTGPPVIAPPSPAPVTPPFLTILINCGGSRYNDTEGRTWSADRYSNGGATYSDTRNNILDTEDDRIYWSQRYGSFSYEIPMPLGNYEVILHFADTYFGEPGSRIFDVNLENEEFLANVDVVRQAGQGNTALKIPTIVPVMDGFLTLQFLPKVPEVQAPMVSGIEVRRAGDHFSHAVIGGPYKAVDVDGDGFGMVAVDGSQSHTHGPIHNVSSYSWRIGKEIIGSGKITTLNISVGEHELTLTVVDTSESISSDSTTVVVKPKGFPELFSLSPVSGDIAGGTVVTLQGQDIGNATSVNFGRIVVPRQDITVIDSGSISVRSPGPAVGVPVKVSVVTPVGESNTVKFTFVSSTPIEFNVTRLMSFNKPTALSFGPDGKLYVATQDGTLSRITLNDSYDTVVSSITTRIDAARCILGIAFDPMETPEMGASISVYISTSLIYHGQSQSTFGNAVNGKIQKVNGPNLEIVTDVITGLPVSEIDHSVNAVYFGNNGELYFGTGSNTNAGFPGGILGSGQQLENYFSAAILVANLGQPSFNGFITYDAPNNGNPITGFGPNGVEVFGAGTRNPFGVTMHTNGKVYATDNGPNTAYGPKSVGCNEATDKLPGPTESDKVLLVKRGEYYGHPNHKRAETDPRQCVWQSNFLPSNSSTGYTAPLMRVQSSTCGIIEFESDHFGGQMRGDLILSKYNSALFRVILSPDGESVNVFTDPAVELDGNGGLAVTQAPDGSLIDVRHTDGNCHIFKPVEAASSVLDIKSVFPRRGGLAGGSKFMIFGVNFGASPDVTVGGNPCANVTLDSSKKITCILPPGTVGRKNVTVTVGAATDTFVGGYRYITGVPA